MEDLKEGPPSERVNIGYEIVGQVESEPDSSQMSEKETSDKVRGG